MAGGYSAPGVYRKLIDLSDTLRVNNASNGGIIIRSKMGPIKRPVLITNSKEFVETFGEPYYVSGTNNSEEGKMIPEFGYGSYGAIEFLKESSTLYVVRAFGDGDKYSTVGFTSNGVITSGAGGLTPDTTIPETFDRTDKNSTYDTYEEMDMTTDKLLVGCVGTGKWGNNYAVTIESINPACDWLYSYDEFPADTSATYPEIPVNPDPETTYFITSAAKVWGMDGYMSTGERFASVNSVNISGAPIILDVEVKNYTGYVCPTSASVSACTDTWVFGYTTTSATYDVPDWSQLSFNYVPSLSTITIGEFNTSSVPITDKDIYSVTELPTGQVTYTFMLDVDNDGSFFKYDYTLGSGHNAVSGVGGPAEVYRHFPIASDVIKVVVYKKSDKVENWTDLYANENDRIAGRLRLEPVEVFYGTMTPKIDADGNELFIERVINGKSKLIYVKAKSRFGNTNEAPTFSWDYGQRKLTIPNGNDDYGYYIKYDQSGIPSKPELQTHVATLYGGAFEMKTGMNGVDSDFWDYFINREEVPVSILINHDYSQQSKLKVAGLCNQRKDCVATNQVGSVKVVNYQNIIATETYGYPSPYYMALYAGYGKVYDTYNDKFVYLPNSIFAGEILARVDRLYAPWYAPAGITRGIIPVMDENKLYSTEQIGKMYDKNINVTKFIQGAGFVLFGQKTAQLKSSALDRINVIRSVIYIQNNIENSLNQFVFENNTSNTRLRIFSIIDSFLNSIKAGEGLYDYKVVCDNSNNTPDVIDANQLNVDVYLSPVKSIEFIQFTTVVSRTGVNMSDIQLQYS